MNPKAIIESIESNHALMEAQFRELNRIPAGSRPVGSQPHGSRPVAASGANIAADVSQLLSDAVHGHLSGASQALNALAAVGDRLREAADAKAPNQRQPETIDAESVVVESKDQ